jgi:hypothetical protein
VPYTDHSTTSYLGLADPAFVGMGATERWRYFRRRIWERDAGICGLCREPVALSPLMHLDHVIQRHHGGADHWDNLRATHAACNRQRRRGMIALSSRVYSQRP